MSGLSFPQLANNTSGFLTAIPDREVLGNVSGTSALPSGITSAQLTGLINAFTTASSGAVPASGTSAATFFLNASGTFAQVSNTFSFISSQTASNSLTLDFTSSIDGTFSEYEFIVENLIPSVNGVIYSVLYSTNNGTSYVNGGYLNSNSLVTTSFPITQSVSGSGQVGTASPGANGTMILFSPSTNSNFKMLTSNVFWATAGGALFGLNAGNINNTNTAVINGIRFQVTTATATATFVSGVIRMYGLKGS